MKILVPIKRVIDPQSAGKVRCLADRVDTAGLDWKMNPFDEYALEAALRLTEDGKAPTTRLGEVIVVTLGPEEAESTLRTGLAIGADRAIHIQGSDDELDGRRVVHVLKAVVADEKPDLVLLGKQTVDGEGNYVGQALAAMLDYPMVFAATSLRETDDGMLVERQLNGAQCLMRVRFPAVVTVGLRIATPLSVYSKATALTFEYYDGVRFASLPAVMRARKKPLASRLLSELAPGIELTSRYWQFVTPPLRKPGFLVKDIAELIDRLANEARVI